jgi:acyl-CoA synthetase (AMP-forming)/AMP-acid ligase II
MDFFKLQATAVIRKNSIAFVEHVFALNASRRPVVTVTDEAQAASLAGIQIDRCIVPAEQSGWYAGRHALIHDEIPAQVSYTSGTEGQPKGILLTYANLAYSAERIIEEMKMTADIREYVGVPATFSFGMARFRTVSAVGGQAYMPPRGFDPLELARMLASGEVNALSAVPTLLRILLASPSVIGDAGKSLRWMEIGSQHMTADEKRGVRALFPNALIVQHYGLTEASRSTFLHVSGASNDLLGSVGRPVGQNEVQLSADGRIRIRGPHVATSRIDADGVHDLLTEDGWLQTNDLGHLRSGYLFFDGRADDLINCGGQKIVPDHLEMRIRACLQPGVQIAVAKVPDDQRGDGVLVAVEGDRIDTKRVKEAATTALAEIGVAAGSALHVLALQALPVTGTGKVQRRVLAEQFASTHLTPPTSTTLPESDVKDVLSLFKQEFAGQNVTPQDTFESLGGDSLHYIQFTLGFEQRFGQLPIDWEKLTVAELQRHVGASKESIWRRLESVTLTRAFFMVCIVALHTGAFIYSKNWGAAYFLVMLAGYSVARFQLPEIIRSGSVKTLVGTAKYVAIPTVLMLALVQLLTRKFELPPLLLISNFLDPYSIKGYAFYFVEFYIQLLLLAAFLFSFANVRESFRLRPMVSALVLLVSVVLVDRTIESIWSGDYNFHRTPWHYAWAFSLGMVIAAANDLRSRLLALAVSTVAVLVVWRLTSAAVYVGVGCAIVLFVRAVVVPAPVKLVVAEIASASMFIYLTHHQMITVVKMMFGEHKPWISLMASIVAGIAFAHCYAWCARTVTQVWNEALTERRNRLSVRHSVAPEFEVSKS